MEYIYKQYEVETQKKLNEKKVVTISDLHLNENITKYELDDLIIKINDLLPEYIFILGDVTSYNHLQNKNFQKNLLYFLKVLASLAKTYMVFGNHDYLIDSKNKLFFTNLNNLLEFYDKTNVKVLHNYVVEDNDMNIVGFDKLPIYYDLEMKDFSKLKEQLLYLLTKIKKVLENQKYTILLTHSHLDFLKLEKDILKVYDLILAGHTHNGLVPNNLERFFQKNQGFITHKKFFLDNIRGMIEVNNTPPIIVNGGITKIGESHSQVIKTLTKPLFKGEIDYIKIKGC